MDIKQQIGKSIKTLRQEALLSQEQLAKLIGTTHASISYWENGVNIPNILDCWKLADVFNVSIDYLVGRKNY